MREAALDKVRQGTFPQWHGVVTAISIGIQIIVRNVVEGRIKGAGATLLGRVVGCLGADFLRVVGEGAVPG